ncbi:hypothetical protein ACFRAU_14010 [Arthrobacter sp. NPDC056691]|uniref:hypothetical protein n=1 Tax=Arthrobacter sp. NPDC056691 TaxID=3345913 RepID=UPI00366A6290
MDFSLAMAAFAINAINHEALSALPDAPVVAPPPSRRPLRSAASTRRRLAPLQGWLASSLHRAAWALEPDAHAVASREYSGVSAICTDDRQCDTRAGTR